MSQEKPTNSLQARLIDGFTRLQKEGIEVFIAAGNHDPLAEIGAGGWDSLAAWPENIHFFPARPESFAVERQRQTLALIPGISYSKREEKNDLAAKLARSPENVFQVGVAHATIGEANAGAHQPYAPTSMETLERSGLDYWALGHVHTRTVLRQSSPAIVRSADLSGSVLGPAI